VEFTVQDISLDRDGRISITDPRITGRLHAAVKRPKPPKAPTAPDNANCNGCNTVDGCAPHNFSCSTNSVKGCGGTKIEEGRAER
jgi:hypothetical protein